MWGHRFACMVLCGALMASVTAGCSSQSERLLAPPAAAARATPDQAKSERAREQAAAAEGVPQTVAAQERSSPTVTSTPTAVPTPRPTTPTATPRPTETPRPAATPLPPTRTPVAPTSIPPPPQAQPSAGVSGGGGNGPCDPSYPAVCIPPSPPDLDCADVPFKRFKVLAPDPHRFDGDGDGVGCES